MTRRKVRSWAPLAGTLASRSDSDNVLAVMDVTRRARRDLNVGVGTWDRGPITYSIRSISGTRMLILTTVATKPEGTLS